MFFRINVEKILDPRVKPEDDNSTFLFVIPAVLKRESIQNYGHFNLFTNEPNFTWSQKVAFSAGFFLF
jgi:hypothetical protein